MAATMQGIAGGAKARRDQASLAVLGLIVLTSTVNLKRGTSEGSLRPRQCGPHRFRAVSLFNHWSMRP